MHDPPPEGAIDWTAALEAVDGRQDLLVELIQIFFTEQELLLGEISQAVAAGEAHDLQIAAHRLKGCLRYFGNSPASDTAWELEQLGRQGSVDGAAELVSRLHTSLDQLLPQLERYVDEHPAV